MKSLLGLILAGCYLSSHGLFAQQNVTLLPGRYLSRDTEDGNPGEGRVRMALVAETDVCIEAAQRIKQYVQSLKI